MTGIFYFSGKGNILCLACYHRCPNNAVLYNNKPNKMPYSNPNVPENEIGKDIL